MKGEEEQAMLDETGLEKRLSVLEQTVADLQLELRAKATSSNWLARLTGSVSDEAAFLEASEYGRTWRQSDRPTDGDSPEKS